MSSSAALSINDHWPVSELTAVKIVSFYSTETSFSVSNKCRFNLNNILLVYVHIKTFSSIQVSFVLVEMAAVRQQDIGCVTKRYVKCHLNRQCNVTRFEDTVLICLQSGSTSTFKLVHLGDLLLFLSCFKLVATIIGEVYLFLI